MNHSGAEILEQIKQGESVFMPGLSIDHVIFGYEEDQLKVLLLEMTPDTWMLPGGYIYKTEGVEAAARRILQERTGLESPYLKQFAVFGGPDRSFGPAIEKMFNGVGIPWEEDLWINKRFVSVGHYALVHIPETKPTAGLLVSNHKWAPVNTLPELLLDHKHIINSALKQLQADLNAFPIAFHLLPTVFSMPELHQVFQTIQNRAMDRSRFQKKMFSYGVFQRLNNKRTGVAHRSPYLYKPLVKQEV